MPYRYTSEPVKNKLINNDDYICINGVYFHGQLEIDLDNDIVYSLYGSIPQQEGCHSVSVILDDNIVNVQLYLWYSLYGDRKGVIVYEDDNTAVDQASNFLKKRANIL